MRAQTASAGRNRRIRQAVKAVIEQMESRVLLAGNPSIPAIPDLIAASDSGIDSADNITNKAAGQDLSFDIGSVSSGNTVYIKVDGTVRGSAVASGTTARVTLNLGVLLSDGTHLITAYQSNGKNSGDSAALTITIDTTAPTEAATITLRAASDTGTSSTDRITRINTPTFDISGGTYLQITHQGVPVASWVATPTWTSAPVADGFMNFSASVMDSAGNVGPSTAEFLTIDTIAPAAPTSAPDLQTASDTGISNTDNITSAAQPSFTLSADQALYRDGIAVGTGAWPDGTYSVTTRAYDFAGNYSSDSPALIITIDTAAPAIPAAPDLTDASDSGISATDNITNATNLYFDVAATPYFRFYDGPTLLSAAYASSTFTSVSSASEGVHTYGLSAVDAAGNESAKATLVVTVDRTAPAPTIDLQPGSDSGASNTDNITNDRTPTLDLISTEPGTLRWRIDSGPEQVLIAGGTNTITIDGDFGAWSSSVAVVSNSTAGEEIVAGDFDNDGFCDLLLLSSGTRSFKVLKGDGTGTFVPQAAIPTGMSYTGRLLVADLDADGYRDVIVAGNGIKTFFGQAGGSFTAGTLSTTPASISYQPRFADFNNDGLLDLVYQTSNSFQPFLATAPGIFSAQPAVTWTSTVSNLAAGDFTGDSRSDVVVVNSSSGQVAMFASQGDGTFGSATTVATVSGASTATAGDFTSDGKPDLALTNESSFYVLPGQGNGTFAAPISSTTFSIPAQGAADINGDGFLDLWGASSSAEVAYGDGAGHFTDTPQIGGALYFASRVAVGDVTSAPGMEVMALSDGLLELNSRTNGFRDGWRSISVTLEDLAGNRSAPASLSVQVDTVSRGMARSSLSTATDTGTSAYDGITNADTLVFNAYVNYDANSTGYLLADGVTSVPATIGSNTMSATLSGLAEGTHSIVFYRTDAAGNTAFGGAQTVVVDRTPPTGTASLSLYTDTGISFSDWITSTATPTINSSASQYRIYVDGAAVADRYAGNYTLSALTDGDHLIEVAELDTAGNVGPRTSRTITIDTVAPAAPTAPDLTDASDSGISATDNITRITTPTLSLSGYGAYHRLYRDTTVLGSSYRTDPTYTASTLSAGTYVYRLIALDAAGNTSPEVSTTITIDTLAPAAPAALDLTDASDSGLSNTDNLTNATTPAFTFTAAPYFRFYAGTTLLSDSYASGSGFTTPTQSDGTWTYGVSAVDDAGNESAKTTLNVTIDTAAPAAPTLSLRSQDDSGLSASDGVTNVTTPMLLLSASGYAIFQQDGADLSGSYTNVNSYLSSPLADGTYSFTARISDVAGNTVTTNAVTVTVDTTAPAAPSALDLDAASDSGISDSDNVTNDATPSFMFAAGEYFRFYSGTTLLSSSYATGSAFTLSAQPDGTSTYGVSAIDAAGNESAMATLGVTIDTTAPAAPSLDLPAQYDTRESNTDNVTSLRNYLVEVGGGPYLRLFRQGTQVGEDYSTQNQFAESNLADGVYAYQAYARDAAGNESPATSLTVTVDTAMPTPLAPALLAASDTGMSNSDRITQDNTPAFAGPAGYAFRAFVDGVVASEYLPAGSVFTTELLSDGDHQVAYQYRDGDAESPVGPATTVTIDTVAPDAPGTPDLLASSDSGVSNSDNITNVSAPSFLVTGATYYRMIVNGTPVTAHTDWQNTIPSQPSDVISVSADSMDVAGNISAASGSLQVTIDLRTPYVIATDPINNGSAMIPFTLFTLELDEAIGTFATNALTLSAGSVTGVSVLADGRLQYALSGLTAEGSVTISLNAGGITDVAGNSAVMSSRLINLDVPTRTLPATQAINPAGSQVYTTSSAIVIGTSADTDSLTITVDAGQRMTVLVDPGSTLRPVLEVRDGSGNLIGVAQGTAAGADLLWTTANLAAGNYTISVAGSDGTTGSATVQVLLNATFEGEDRGGPANDTRAAAEDLNGSFRTISGSLQMASVLGSLPLPGSALPAEIEANNSIGVANSAAGNFVASSNRYQMGISGTVSTNSDLDWFNLGTLESGDVITITESGSPGKRGTLSDPFLRLYRHNGGNPLQVTSDDDGGPGFDSFLRQTISVTDTYYVVGGGLNVTGTYQLGVFLDNTGAVPLTGGAVPADTEANNGYSTAVNASSSWRSAAYRSRTTAAISPSGDVDAFSYLFNAGDLVTIHADSTSSADLAVALRDSSGVVLTSEDGSTSSLGTDSTIYAYRIPATGTYYITINATTTTTGSYTADVHLSASIAPPVPANSIDFYRVSLEAGQTATFAAQGVAASSLVLSLQDATGAVLANGTPADNATSAIASFTAPAAGDYYVVLAGNAATSYTMVATRGGSFGLESDNSPGTARNIGSDGIAAGALANLADGDYYRISVSAGQYIAITAAAPAAGSGEFANALLPKLDLYDGSSVLIASSAAVPAGAAAELVYYAAATGTLTVRVSTTGSAGGEYVLNTRATFAANPDYVPGRPILLAGSDTGVSSADGLTNRNNSSAETALQFAVTHTLAGQTVTIYADGVAIGSAVATGDMTIVTTDGTTVLTDGAHVITARQTVPAAGDSGDAAATSVSIDTAAPGAASIDLASTSDSGTSNSDNITNQTSLSFAITNAPGNYYFRVFRDGVLFSNAYQADNWFYAYLLTDGTRSYTIAAVDAAGNVGPLSSELLVTVDTVAPVAPVLDLDSASDSGLSNTDNITNINTPTLLIGPAGTETYRLYDNTTWLATVNADSSYTFATAVTHGTHAYRVDASDIAGNVRTGVSLSVVIDTVAPTSSGYPDLAVASDSGLSSTDNITNAADVVLTISRTSYYRLWRNGTLISAEYATATPFTDSQAPEGSVIYSQVEVDAAGNVGPTNTLTITVDRTAPDAPAAPDLRATSDDGASASDNQTSVRSPVFEVSAAPYFRFYSDGVQLVGDWLAGGAYQVNNLSEGPHTAAVAAVDVAGNVSAQSPLLAYTITPPVPATPRLDTASDSGISSSDGLTNWNNSPDQPLRFVVTGTAADETVRIYVDGLLAGEALSTGGDTIVTLNPGILADGIHLANATRTAPSASESPWSTSYRFEIDTAAPAAGTVRLNAFDDTGAWNNDRITKVANPRLSLPQTSRFRLYQNGTLIADNAAPTLTTWQLQVAGFQNLGAGAWRSQSITSLSAFAGRQARVEFSFDTITSANNNYEGWYVDDVVVSGTGGTVLQADFETGAQGFTFDNTGGGLWHLSSSRGAEAGHSAIQSFYYGQETWPAALNSYNTGSANRGVLISPVFTLPANAQLTWKDFLHHDGGASTDQARVRVMEVDFTYQLPTLADGSYDYSLAIMDDAGNWSEIGSPATITIDTVAPAVPPAPVLDAASDTGASNSDGVTRDNTPTLHVTVGAGEWFSVLENGSTVGGSIDGSTYCVTWPLADGVHTLYAQAYDLAGNSARGANLTITVDTVAPAIPALPDLLTSSDSGISSSDNLTNDNTPTFRLDGLAPRLAASRNIGGVWSIVELDAVNPILPIRTIATFGDLSNPNVLGTALTADGLHVLVSYYSTWGPSGTYLRKYDFNSGALLSSASVTVTGTVSQVAAAGGVLYVATTTSPTSLQRFNLATGAAMTPLTITGVTPNGSLAADPARNRLFVATTNVIYTVDPATGVASMFRGGFTARKLEYVDDSLVAIDSASPVGNFRSMIYLTSAGIYRFSQYAELGSSYDLAGEGISLPLGAAPTEITIDGTVVSTGGAAEYTAAALADGGHDISARNVDLAGNTSSSLWLRFEIDTVASSATPAAPDLTSASDSGTANDDNLTNVKTPTIAMPAEAGALLYVDGTPTATAYASPTPIDLVTYSGTKETAAWQAVDAVDLSAYAGQLVQLRWYYRADQSVISVTQSEGWYVDDVIVTANGTTLIYEGFWAGLGNFTVRNGPGGFWHVSTGRSGQEGHSFGPSAYFGMKETNTGGGTTDIYGSSFTSTGMDEGSLLSPFFVVPAGATHLNFNHVLGTDRSKDIAKLQLLVYSSAQATAPTLADGVHSLTSATLDPAGNASPQGPALQVTIDTVAPAAPPAPVLVPEYDTGISSTDGITNLQLVMVRVPHSEGQVVLAQTGGNDQEILGTWTDGEEMQKWLFDGPNPYYARTRDAAGNISAPSPTTYFTADLAAPSRPHAPQLDASSDLGASSTDGLTADRTPTFSLSPGDPYEPVYIPVHALYNKSLIGVTADYYEIDPDTGHIMRRVSPVSTVHWFSAEHGMAVSSTDLYHLTSAGWSGALLHRYDLATGAYVSTITLPSLPDSANGNRVSRGLAWLGGSLYTIDNFGGLVRINPADGALTPLPRVQEGTTYVTLDYELAGAPDRGTLFAIDGNDFVEIDPNTAAILRRIPTSRPHYGLAYRTGELVAVSGSGQSSLVELYRYDAETGAATYSGQQLYWGMQPALGGDGIAIPARAEYYRIYRDGVKIADYVTPSSFTDNLALEGEHTYTVAGIDAAGNESPISDGAAATFDFTAPAAPAVAINGGATQRSRVTQIDVTFAEPVVITADAINLLLRSGASPAGTVLDVANPSGDGKTYRLTFSGSAIIGGSLADGVYDLIVQAAGVSDTAGNVMTGDYSHRFHRLFGDNNGDRRVNLVDYTRLRTTLNRSAGHALFNSALDFDGNNAVNVLDLTQFRRRFGQRFTY